MKTRIVNNRPTLQVYTQEWLEEKKEDFINGEFVKNWTVADFPNETELKYIDLMYNLDGYYENATEEQIEKSKEEEKDKLVNLFLEKKKKDGINYSSEIRFKITKELIGKPAVEVNEIDSQCQTAILPLLQLIESVGADWWTAMNKSLQTEEPLNEIALKYFNEVKSFIINYVQTNYPK